MTCVATTSPTRLPAAAPASTALRTAATSPRTIAVTRPASIFSQPTRRTFAALTIASAASIIATRPRHSTIPSASGIRLLRDAQYNIGPITPIDPCQYHAVAGGTDIFQARSVSQRVDRRRDAAAAANEGCG